MKTHLIAATLLISALPALAQEATAPAAQPETAPAETLPPAGEAPVDEIAPVSDAAPDAAGVPDAASARMECSFVSECIDDECAETEYGGTLTVITDGAGLAEAEWSDVSETVALAAVVENGTTLASATETAPARQRLLTVLEDGTARFTTHLTDPAMSITYAGACQ
ncbi:hypothetical protein [Paracoccus sediminicola]|uniref:hypothetical protein n=1 Tax=Paracoccus sediminicola TaxID=3017783 RepID=UPI0022F0C746|nr:hypothetical protein [Paracoccus sediminicola]WBU55454.1 hypothetical protein PAF18_07890 [Paracoccus sediminicola]